MSRLPDPAELTTAAAALQALLGAWSVCPGPQLADAIRELDRVVVVSKPAWQSSPDVLQRGIAARGAFKGPAKKAGGRMQEMQRWTADPRVGDAVLERLRVPPWTSRGAERDFWRDFLDLVEVLADPRIGDERDAIIASWTMPAFVRDRLTRRLEAIDFPDSVDLDVEEQACLATLLERFVAPPTQTERNVDALYAAVYADPTNDVPRQILADVLQEQGDPRGEFIALQLADANPRRQKTLLNKHGADWVGGIGDALVKKGRVFRRGFLAEARVRIKNEELAKRVGQQPAWGTLETLQFSDGLAPVFPTMNALRVLHGGSNTTLAGLLANPSGWPHLEELEVDGDHQLFTRLLATPLPSLRRLKLSAGPAIPELVEAVWFEQLEALVVDGDIGVWVRVLDETGVGSLKSADGTFAFSRGPDGRLSEARIESPGTSRWATRGLAQELARLPDGRNIQWVGRFDPGVRALTGDGAPLLSRPDAIDVAPDGTVYLADNGVLWIGARPSVPEVTAVRVAPNGRDHAACIGFYAVQTTIGGVVEQIGGRAMAWSPDGRLAVAGTDELIIEGRRFPLGIPARFMDFDRLVACASNDQLRIFDPDQGLLAVPNSGHVSGLAWLNGRLVIAGYNGLSAMATSDWRVRRVSEQRCRWARASPDRQRVAIEMQDRSLVVFDAQLNRIASRKFHGLVHAFAWTPDGRLVTTREPRNLDIWDLDADEVQTLKAGDPLPSRL